MAELRGASGDYAEEAKNSSKERKPMENILTLGGEFFRSIKQVPRSRSCHTCGLSGRSQCSRCHQTSYCSVECQKQDWKAHSVICRPAARKEQNGMKTPREANGEGAKVTAPQLPDPKAVETAGRRIMLCDVQEEARSRGTELQGYAVEFSSPSNFFVQAFNAKSVDNLKKVTSSLNNFYSNPSNLKKGYLPGTGEVCVTKYQQDQQWYRALVCNVEATMKTAQVLYLDYGNVETVSLDSVQPLLGEVELLPPCALHCSLAHVTAPPFGWTPECLVEVKSLLVGQKLLIRILDVAREEIPRYTVEVSLPDSGAHIHEIMIEKGYSFPPLNKHRGREKDPETVSRSTTQAEKSEPRAGNIVQDRAARRPEVLSSVRVGGRFMTLITVIHNPEMFFCQQVENAKELSEVMVLMHERYSASAAPAGFSPAPGDICAAQFSEDNTWYRASVVRRVSDESVLVGYLDFGNTETLPISRVRRLEPDLLAIPFQAAQCCLAGVQLQSGEWTSEATDLFKVLVMNKILTASVVKDCDRVLTLELVDDSVTPSLSISQRLIEAGLAVPDTPGCESPASEEAGQREDPAVQMRWLQLPPERKTEVLVCMLQNPGEFFCHIHNQTDLQLLHELHTSLGQHCMQHKSEGYRPALEEICGAYYAGDGNWYRAQVKALTPTAAAKILFLDYGNMEEISVDKLCQIPASFLELPFQAICCSLSGVKPTGETWSEDAIKTFQQSVAGVKLLANAVVCTKRCYSVELSAVESGAVIADVLIAAKCAVRDEKTDEAVTALRPPRRPPVTPSPVLPLCGPDKGAPAHKELSPCTVSPSELMRPVKSALSDAPSAVTKTHKAIPRDVSADRPGGREPPPGHLAPSALSDGHLPRAAPHRSLSSSSSSTSSPIEARSPRSSPAFQKDVRSRNPSSPRGSGHSSREFSSCRPPAPLRRELYSSSSAPFPKAVRQGRSVPPASRDSRFTSSTPLPLTSATLMERGSRPSVPPLPGHQDTSLAEPYKANSRNSAPSPVREFQYSNSSPTERSDSTAGRGVRSDQSSPSDEALHAKGQNRNDQSVKRHPAASQDLPGVSAAPAWISVDLPLNEALPACVLKVVSPDLFYVFPKENRVDVKRLQQVMMEIFEHCSKETDQRHYSPSVGDACCAKFTEDGQWYRAVVLELHEAAAKVAYADYGNVEVLPFSCLLPAKESFLELPVQLTKCSLADVLPVAERWSPEAAGSLSSVLLGAEVLITPKSLYAGRYHVAVEKQQEKGVLHVAERLVTGGLARSVAPMSNGCSEGSGCCCRDLLKRVEKLEEIILHLLNTEKCK